MLITWAWSCPIRVWKYSALNWAIHFHRAFVVETWLVGFALQRVKKKRPVLCRKPLREKHNTALNAAEKSWQPRSQGPLLLGPSGERDHWGRVGEDPGNEVEVLEEWQQQRQNKCAMSELVGVAVLKCKDVQNLTVSLEHMSPNTLY